MKKRVIALVIGIMSCLLLAGCGGATATGETESVKVNADAPNYSENDAVVEDKVEETMDLAKANDHEEPFGTLVEINRDTQKKMNVFLSNFSEAGLSAFDKDDPYILSIVNWAHIWFKINKYDSFTYENRPGELYDMTYEKLSLDDVNKTLDKYLGLKLTEDMASVINDGSEDAKYSFYENGFFYFPAADGEAYPNMSVVTQVEDIGDNRLKLCYGMYSQDLDAYFDGKEIDYTMTGDEAEANPEYELMESGYAIVSTDGSSYKLEYLEQK